MNFRTHTLLTYCCLLIIPLKAEGQYKEVKGIVYDQQTNEKLVFVHLVINNSRSGTTSGIDGRFELHYPGDIRLLTLSYVGYQTLTIDLAEYLSSNSDQTPVTLKIALAPETKILSELVFEAGENPAHPIIRKAVANRRINNPEKIKSFKYTSYNKFLVDAENFEDIEEDMNDSSDSTDGESFSDFIATKYLFLMESVTERKYLRPDRSKETVIANRVSGFKNPLFTTLANSFQPFSFYGNYINVAGKNYLNPVSKGSTSKYFFSLEDSIYSHGHKVYIIRFEPRKRNFEGLKGLLYVNTYKYAIENVIAETANLVEHFADNIHMEVTNESNEKSEENQQSSDSLSRDMGNNEFEQISVTFKIQQKYDLIADSIWFPLQLNTDINIGDATGSTSAVLKGIGRSYLSDIELLPDLRRREFDRLALEFDLRANKRDSAFWEKYRIEPIDDRGRETYSYIDSVGEEAHLDRIVTGMALLTTGKIRVGKINLDADKFMAYNRFESIRLGAGLHTNSGFSTFFNIGGYAAFGFGDKAFKYGGDINFFLTEKNNITLSALYQKDVIESGGTKFYLDNNPLSSETNRKFMIGNMDQYENMEVAASLYFLKYMDVRLALSQNTRQATSGYNYAPPTSEAPVLQNIFDFTEIKAGMKYSFREKYIEILGNKVSTGTKYPVVWINYTRGLDNIGHGQFDYQKWDFKVQKSFLIKGFGKPSFTIKGGLATGNVPATNLYNGNGSKLWEIPLEAINSFQTMYLNEFLSDRYVALYYSHNLGKVTINPRRSTPEFILVTNLGWGSLSNPERHLNYTFNTMEKGYYESGLSIRNIYKLKTFIGLGLAGFYRYGPYARPDNIDNLAVKLTVKFSL